MAFEHKDGSGSLFKNDRKAGDTHPDYQGTLSIGGVTYRINGWIKDGSRGKYLSLSARPKDEQQQPERAYAQRRDDMAF
jgi:hypothetical protein